MTKLEDGFTDEEQIRLHFCHRKEFAEQLIRDMNIRKELEHGREAYFRLVKDIPVEQTDVLDRERWAVISFCNYILGNQIEVVTK